MKFVRIGRCVFAMCCSLSMLNAHAQQTPKTASNQAMKIVPKTDAKLSPTEEELQRRVTPKISKLDFRSALNEVSIMIVSDTANATLYNVRAALNTQLYNFADAARDYDKIIALQPKNVYAYQSRAQLRLEHLNNTEGALQDWTRVVALDSLNPSAWYSRGALYQTMQQFEEARRDYTQCLRTGIGENATVLTQRGFCAMKLKQSSDAMNDFNAAISITDSATKRSIAAFDAFFYRGSLHFQRRKFAEAIFDFDAALRLNDQSGETYYLRGYAKMLGGHTEDGCIDLSQANELKYAQAAALIEQYCDVVGNLDSLRRYTMPTVTVTAGRSRVEIAMIDSRRLLGRVTALVGNPSLQQQNVLPTSTFAFQNPPGMMSPFDCNKQRLEMSRPSQINIGCVAQVLQEELRKVPDATVRTMVDNIMNTANDLYIMETTGQDTRAGTASGVGQDINKNQAMLIRLRLAEQFRDLNDLLEKMQGAKKQTK